jgi:hypothetical protein
MEQGGQAPLFIRQFKNYLLSITTTPALAVSKVQPAAAPLEIA